MKLKYFMINSFRNEVLEIVFGAAEYYGMLSYNADTRKSSIVQLATSHPSP
jgi:hypothetical protein